MDNLFESVSTADRIRSESELFDGIIKVLFIIGSPLLIDEIFFALRAKLALPDFQSNYMEMFRTIACAERDSILAEIKICEHACKPSYFYERQLPYLEEMLSIKNIDEYINWLDSNPRFEDTKVHLATRVMQEQEIGLAEATNYVNRLYSLYSVTAFLYERYKSRIMNENFIFDLFDSKESQQLLLDTYRTLGVNLLEQDAQFLKYDLISLDENLIICNQKDSQTLIEKRTGIHFTIHVPRDVLLALESLIDKGYVREISFRIGTIAKAVPSLENLEYGSFFSFRALELPKFSKFYNSKCFDDSLWIHVDHKKSSITFEELYRDFPERDGCIATQVIHLELTKGESDFFISHLDHEYIIYTLDEYINRQTNPKQKGHKKCKTFKIDNARIPFDYKCSDRHFIFQVLDSHFNNKELIREYFSLACLPQE
ncbi:hypothetical protein [Pseudomonas sp. S3E17]|uniref:hypothetical protein n=1 Tax=Pseudomonas sp. S3E17 TaxID=2817893 RepID=UPI0020A1B3C5|nr:hypothetical protein [Pseudomonas sp. S3E17]MCP1465552.1 hypothetical protein [Pseudomonas sp. S3E17]